MKKRDIFFVYLGGLLMSFAYGIYFSAPLFIQKIGGNEATTGRILAVCGLGTIMAVLGSKFLLKKAESKNIASLGALSYALGSIGFLFVTDLDIFLVVSSLMLGLGWGLYYNSTPLILSMFATNNNRSTLFNYLSAFTVLGSGCTPVFFKIIWGNQINFYFLFMTAVLICVIACIIFYSISSITVSDTSEKQFTSCHEINEWQTNFDYTIIYPLTMVFLGACVVTVMLNFQTTLANTLEMNYASFFTIYSLVVVGARFTLGKFLSKFNQYYLIINLLILMTTSLLCLHTFIYNKFIYSVNTALFAISYGLLYPTIQAIAVNLTPIKNRIDIMSYFSLLYFVGLYGFPPIAGFFIVHFGYRNMILVLSLLSAIELLLGVFLCKAKLMNTTKYFAMNR